MAAVRQALLKRLRVNATSLSLLRNPKPSLNGLFALTFNAVHRRFSDDVMGSFLDKSEVTDRVVSVVKNFQKVDPSKVPTISLTYQNVVADNSVYVKTPLMMLGYRNLMGRGGLQEWLVHAFELNKGGIDVGVADFLGKMRVEQQECDLLDSIYDEYPKESEDLHMHLLSPILFPVAVFSALPELGSDEPLVTPNAHFQNDLGLDSLDTVEVVMALEEEFGFEIPDNEADKISTINHAVEFIASHPQAK
ncbi:hypothetical protein Gohar_016679 [Gossypium harknessii]|uniref:Acyl carrier protein n=1 Tax=Gossypium harknessii TaxID=34285 RepID=A0A7J9G3H8_9ROSI|nr:hypothetical protein [Gossypium harknessii]